MLPITSANLRRAAAFLCSTAALSAALVLSPSGSASAATTFPGVRIPVADWGGQAMTTLTEYPDSSGVHHRWLLTPGVDVSRVEGPARQRVDVSYVLERRKALSASQWGEWVQVQSDTRSAVVTGDQEAHLRSQNYEEPERAAGTAEYRYVFVVQWRDADTNEYVAGARVQPSVGTDASCLQIANIPCKVTAGGTIYSGYPF